MPCVRSPLRPLSLRVTGICRRMLIGQFPFQDELGCSISRKEKEGDNTNIDPSMNRNPQSEAAHFWVKMIRSPTLDRPKAEFSGIAQGDGLVAPPDFVSMIGTLFPIAPCGRSSL